MTYTPTLDRLGQTNPIAKLANEGNVPVWVAQVIADYIIHERDTFTTEMASQWLIDNINEINSTIFLINLFDLCEEIHGNLNV